MGFKPQHWKKWYLWKCDCAEAHGKRLVEGQGFDTLKGNALASSWFFFKKNSFHNVKSWKSVWHHSRNHPVIKHNHMQMQVEDEFFT